MIEIEITRTKFRRTYIGGSKKKEIEIFLKVQGIENDNSDCDWLEYRRLLKTYLDDVLLVLGSWKNSCSYESYVMLLVSVMFMKYIVVFHVFIGLGVLFQILRFIFKKKEKNKLATYSLCQTILLNEIRKATGMNLDKI
jgi:hypothetical protein